MQFSGFSLIEPVKDLKNEPIPMRGDHGEILTHVVDGKTVPLPLTIKEALRQALTSNQPTLQEDDARKYENYDQAKKILSTDPNGSIEFTTTEVAYIKKKVSLTWGIEIVGFLFDYLEGKTSSFNSSVGNA
jgi:hypothetical protein